MEPEDIKTEPRFTKKRILIGAGAAIGLVILIVAVAGLVIFYKATRKFPLAIVDIVPADALAFVETDNLAASWPRIETFLGKIRTSPRYKRILSTEPALSKADLDGQIEGALQSLEQIREQSGVNPIEAVLSYSTAIALFAEEVPPQSPDEKKPTVRVTFVAYTFLKGLKVRVAALFADTALSSAAPEGMQATEKDGYTTLTFSQGKDPIHFAVLQDLLVVSNDEARMVEVLDLAGLGIAPNLATHPAFTEVWDELPLDQEPADLRVWIDFVAAERLFHVKEKSEVKVSIFPYVYIARLVNGLQRSVLDLENTQSLLIHLTLDEEGNAFLARGIVRYASSNPFLMQAYNLPAAPPFGFEVAPPGTVCLASARKDFREFWNQLGDEGDVESRESFYQISERHGPLFENIIEELGNDYALFFKQSPHGRTRRPPDAAPPFPWVCAAARSTAPHVVAKGIKGILQSEIDRRTAKAPAEELPVLRTENRGEASICFLDNLPMEVRTEVSPDFRPGFFVLRDTVGVFSSAAFAYEIIDFVARGQTLAQDPAYAQVSGRVPPQHSAGLFVDVHRLLSMLQGYRTVIAKGMRPLDWEEAIRTIEARHGRNLPEAQMERYKDAWLANVKHRRNALAARLAMRFQNLRIIRSMALTGSFETDAANRTPRGIRFTWVLQLDLE